MLDISEELRLLVAKLDQQNIEYALCGGMAMAIYDRPRFTIDIDLLIQEESLAAAINVAESLAYDIRGKDLSLAHGTVEIRRMSKVDPDAGDLLTVDFLLVTPQVREAWDSRIESEWEGGKLTVVSRAGLIALKKLSTRPQDVVDIDLLMEDSGDGEG
jgi:Nucleotidyl transferase AbiEii toxin, Type IV TA system